MISFAFVGRLTEEKWFDLVLEGWDMLSREYPDIVRNIRIFVFGDGPLRTRIEGDWFHWEDALEAFPEETWHRKVYFWYRSSKEIWDFLKTYETYTLMPSRFLETFWLVALESLNARIPVIGPKKWWLTPFIADELTLHEDDIVWSMREIIKGIAQGTFDRKSLLASVDIRSYALSSWREKLSTLLETDLGNPDRVLLVNDYISLIGGAEVYTTFLKWELERLWKTVFVTGYSGRMRPFTRRMLFLLAPFSFWRRSHLRNIIEHFHPDMIWCQSVMRYIGPWWLSAIRASGVTSAITHHDLGAFTYLPSRVFQESDIPKDDSLGAFVRSTHARNIFSLLGVFFKWSYLRSIHIYFRKIEHHFVPSEFMTEHLTDFGIEKKWIILFPHSRIENLDSQTGWVRPER